MEFISRELRDLMEDHIPEKYNARDVRFLSPEVFNAIQKKHQEDFNSNIEYKVISHRGPHGIIYLTRIR